MSYMIEGGGSPTLSRAKAWLYRHKDSSHQLLQAITEVCIEYLEGQVAAGAQALQVRPGKVEDGTAGWRDRQTDRQIGRQAGRQTDRQTDRWTDRQTDRQTD